MNYGLLLIVVFIAATALTSGEYSSAFMVKPKDNNPQPDHNNNPLDHNNNPPPEDNNPPPGDNNKTTTIRCPKTTTTRRPKTTTTRRPKTTTTRPKTTTTRRPKTTTTRPKTTTTRPKTTTTRPKTTTTRPKTTTTRPKTTTTRPKTTTTRPPKTTTTRPKTTTTRPKTTTTRPPKTTTTSPPKTTTTRPKTTTTPPAPMPPTNRTKGSYNVTDAKGKICILADLEIGIRVNTSQVNGTFIVQPSKTNHSGECLDKTANITLSFVEGHFILKFKNDETKKKVYVELVEYSLNYAFKRGELRTYAGKNESLELFSAAPGHSYSCSAETVYMGNGVSLDLTDYRLQAFNIKNNQFGTTDLCKADQPDYRIPIAVGVILIILIVIVVIAYLISRKRRSYGYQSL